MREIKFRGKRIDNGEWVYGDLIHHNSIVSKTSIVTESVKDYRDCFVIDYTVGQFTGLKDKHGKEIYEGDIVLQRGYGRIKPMVVRFEQGAFIVGWHNGSSTATRPMLIQKRGEIIGNIHDNKSLLI